MFDSLIRSRQKLQVLAVERVEAAVDSRAGGGQKTMLDLLPRRVIVDLRELRSFFYLSTANRLYPVWWPPLFSISVCLVSQACAVPMLPNSPC